MKTKAISTLLLMSLLILPALGQNNSKMKHASMNFEKVLERKKKVLLSDIVKSIRYIKLETTEESILGGNGIEVTPFENYLFITQPDRPLIVFDNNGKFVRTIGRIGRAPEEYGNGYSVSIDKVGERIFILNRLAGNIMAYSWTGVYLFKIETEKPIVEFEYLKNNTFCGYLKFEELLTASNKNYVIFNDKGKVLNSYHFQGYANQFIPFQGDKSKPVIPLVHPRFTSSPIGVNINTYQNDSIFKVTLDGEIYPAMLWDPGKFNPPFSRFDRSIPKAQRDKYISTVSAIETEKYWFVRFDIQGKNYKSILEKETNQYYEVEDSNPLKNDIDGGPSFWPFVESYKGKVFAIPISPIQLKRQLENGNFDNKNVKFPAKNTALKEFIKSLDINDNQIIMLVELL
jgi:hypothetical protein